MELSELFSFAEISWGSYKSWFRTKGCLWGPAIFLTIMFAVEGSFWTAMGTSSLSGYQPSELLLYSFTTLIIYQIIAVIGEPDSISSSIENGELIRYLVRPCSALSQLGAIQVGTAFARFTALLPIFLGLHLTLGHHSAIQRLPFLLGLLILAALLNALINQCLGILSFWFNESYAFVIFKETLFWILSGTLIPLNFFPNAAGDLLKYNPAAYLGFHLTHYSMERSDFLPIVLGQLIYIAIFASLAGLLWRNGVRRFQSHGG